MAYRYVFNTPDPVPKVPKVRYNRKVNPTIRQRYAAIRRKNQKDKKKAARLKERAQRERKELDEQIHATLTAFINKHATEPMKLERRAREHVTRFTQNKPVTTWPDSDIIDRQGEDHPRPMELFGGDTVRGKLMTNSIFTKDAVAPPTAFRGRPTYRTYTWSFVHSQLRGLLGNKLDLKNPQLLGKGTYNVVYTIGEKVVLRVGNLGTTPNFEDYLGTVESWYEANEARVCPTIYFCGMVRDLDKEPFLGEDKSVFSLFPRQEEKHGFLKETTLFLVVMEKYDRTLHDFMVESRSAPMPRRSKPLLGPIRHGNVYAGLMTAIENTLFKLAGILNMFCLDVAKPMNIVLRQTADKTVWDARVIDLDAPFCAGIGYDEESLQKLEVDTSYGTQDLRYELYMLMLANMLYALHDNNIFCDHKYKVLNDYNVSSIVQFRDNNMNNLASIMKSYSPSLERMIDIWNRAKHRNRASYDLEYKNMFAAAHKYDVRPYR